MKDMIVIVLIPCEGVSEGKSRGPTRAYDVGWERIFGKKEENRSVN